MSIATMENHRRARTFRPHPGDRISFGGIEYIVSVNVETGGLVVNEKPDPFYSPENMARLRRALDDINAGRVTEHELIEA